MESVDVQSLLRELCVDYGYCLPPDEQDRFLMTPPTDVDDFTDAVLTAEGRDPQVVLKSERQVVRDVVAKYLER